MKMELIADYACACGEGPLWHPDEERLYWVDIPTGSLFRYTPATGTHERCFDGEALGGFTIQHDGALLLFMARGTVKLWRDGVMTTVIESLPGEEESRFNDVIADPAGRVFCGTMPTPDRDGRLYRLDCDGTIRVILEDIGCSNGMGFTPDRKSMYYIDSPALEVYVFDYNEATGELSNQRVLIKTIEGEGIPDGMTVDADGYLWVAKWDGHSAIRFAPDGTEVERIEFPAKKVSCVTFGGPTYSDMYVTTAGGNDEPSEGEHAGALFRLPAAVPGVPEFRSRIGIK